MRGRTRRGVHPHADWRSTGATGEVWQLRHHARAQYQKWLRRIARLPKPALDGILQISRAIAQGLAVTRPDQPKRAQATRVCLRFSVASPHGDALPREP